jgi:hypothetical protein
MTGRDGMAGILVWGKGFTREPTVLPSGEPFTEVNGIAGGCESISWSSVGDIQRIAAEHGVSRTLWPTYAGVDNEADIPLEDAQRRSAALRSALDDVPADVIDNDYWLSFVARILRAGNSFFVMT